MIVTLTREFSKLSREYLSPRKGGLFVLYYHFQPIISGFTSNANYWLPENDSITQRSNKCHTNVTHCMYHCIR